MNVAANKAKMLDTASMRTSVAGVGDDWLPGDEQRDDDGKGKGFPTVDTFHFSVSCTVCLGRFPVNRSDDHTIGRPRTHSAPKKMVNC